MSGVKTFSNSCFNWLYPPRCALCSILGDEAICINCLQEFVAADQIRTAIGDGPLKLTATLYPYRGRVGQAVRRLKYSRGTALAMPMAAMMAEGLSRLGLTEYNLIVPVPIHWSRLFSRGFNQSVLLAEGLPRVNGKALQRIRRTKPQARLSRVERLSNLDRAFRAQSIVEGKTILLIDDVLTSGETVRECAKALAAAGAREVAALAFAGEPGWS